MPDTHFGPSRAAIMLPSSILFLSGTILLSLNLVRPLGYAISDWLYLGSLAFALLETLTVDRRNFSCWINGKLLLAAGAITAGSLLSMTRSVHVRVALVETVQLLYVLTLFMSLVWIMIRRGHIGGIAAAFIVSGTFAASVALVDYLAGTQFGATLSGEAARQLWGRYAGPLGHPNKLGYFLVLTAALTLPMALSTQRRLVALVLAGSLWVQVAGIYLSGSVTAYLGLVLTVVVMLVASGAWRRRLAGLAASALLLLALVSYMVGSNPARGLQTIAASIRGDADRVSTITYDARLNLYRLAASRIWENPFVGAGFDQFSTSGLGDAYRLLPGTVHNVFLQGLYSGGLLVLLGWLVFYFYLVHAAVKTLIKARELQALLVGLAASAFALVLMDQFQDAIYQREKWLVAGLLLGAVWVSKPGREASRPPASAPGSDAEALSRREQAMQEASSTLPICIRQRRRRSPHFRDPCRGMSGRHRETA